MNVLIVYSGKYGTAASCANILAASLEGEMTVLDIKNISTIAARLEEYNTIIVGGSLYVGKVSKELRDFCKEHLTVLLSKQVGMFLCGVLAAEIESCFPANFPEELLKTADARAFFGGVLHPEKMSFFDKAIVKLAVKEDASKFTIDETAIKDFARRLNHCK